MPLVELQRGPHSVEQPFAHRFMIAYRHKHSIFSAGEDFRRSIGAVGGHNWKTYRQSLHQDDAEALPR